MYNLIEHSDNYSKTSEEPILTDAGARDNSPGNSALFKFKQKVTGKITGIKINQKQQHKMLQTNN